MTAQTAIRCNGCGEITIIDNEDATEPAEWRCPYCTSNKSLSVRSPVKDFADARRLFAAEERQP